MKTFLNKNKTIFTVLLSFVIALMFVIGYGLTASANTTVNASPAEPTITINAYVVDAQNPTLQSKSLKAGDEFQIKYVVSQNDGVDALDLTLSYDEENFTLGQIVVNENLLGAATQNNAGEAHLVLENATSRNGAAYPTVADMANGDLLLTATFTVKNNDVASINEFSLDAASIAYAIVEPESELQQATHKEVEIITTNATINLRTDFQFSVEDVERIYNKASELNADIIANRITIPQAELNAVEDGIALPTFIVHWFQGGDHNHENTDIIGTTAIENATGSQIDVGTRFFSIEVVENDFYNGARYFEVENYEIVLHDARHFYDGQETGDQHTGYYSVEPKEVTVEIAPKTVPYQAFTAAEITEFVTNSQNYAVSGIIEGDPALTITAVDSQYVLTALPGNYPYVRANEEENLPITTNYDGSVNYTLTVSGNLTIGKLQLNMDDTTYVNFLGDNVDYDGEKHTIAVEYANNAIGQDLANALTVTYTGGEDDANGRTNVGSSPITATFAIKNEYANRYEFVEVDNVTKNVKTATLTITASALTQEQVDALVAQFAHFYAVDNGTANGLTITNQTGAYTRNYNGNPVYIGVVVDSNNNEALSTTVRYKVGDALYTELEAALASFENYARTNAGVDTVYVEFMPTSNYAFAQDVDAEYVITLTINKLALEIKATATATYGDADAVITVDNGEGWLDGEAYATYNTSVEALKQYVATGYGYGDNAGAEREIVWGNDAEEYAELKLYNYDVILTTENFVVAKKVINLNSEDFTFAGYASEYDGASHNLTVTIAQAQQGLVTYEITPKAAVKDVADSGTYTATFALVDATNYAFADNDNTLTAEVEITPKALTLNVEYTENTATFTLTGFAGEETKDVLTGLTFSVDGDALTGNVYTTSETGEFAVSASYTNTNYTVEDEDLLAVYELTFNKNCDDTVAGMPQGGFYFAGQAITAPESNPTRNHYTFIAWVTESEGSTAFAFANGLSQNATAFAKWNVIAQHKLSYVIVYGDGNASEEVVVGNFYEDDTITYTTLPQLLEHDWFRTEKWFTNQALTAKFANGTHLNDDTIVYAGYKFNIGLGDVNADGLVSANDITLYRKWIVGGYTMEVVESGDEWATVTANDYDKTLVYFLKGVADANAQTLEAEELGDGNRDIRDVSTIRMALVGGYGFAIVEQNGVTGAELAISRNITIDTLQKMLMIAQSGKTVTLAQDLADANFDGVIANCQNNITINLGGHTITLNSLNIALKDNEVKTITISNGTINTAEGFSVLAPAGNVVFENLTVYEAGEQIQLQAASSSLHFNGAVKFYKAENTPAAVKVENGTHVVVEQQAQLTIAKVVVTEEFEPVEELGDAKISITVESEKVQQIIVEGYVEIDSNNEEVVKPTYLEVSTKEELIAAAANQDIKEIKLMENLADTGEVNFNHYVVINGNGKTISGNSALRLNKLGAKVSNVKFQNIHNSVSKLTPIYGTNLEGKLEIENCEFDTFDWDAIQTTPVAGAQVVVKNNTFRHSGANNQNTRRYVHIQSEKNVDFAATIENNKFYNAGILQETAIEVYYPTDESKIVIRNNYVDKPVGVCILKNSGADAWQLANHFVEEDLETPVTMVARIDAGNTYLFKTLQEAVDFAGQNQTTITLLDNANGDGVIVPENSNITFDFAGHTYLVDGQNLAGSTGTKTQCFQLLKNSNVTFKNGTLRTTTAKMMIQNYANTTLDNFTVSGEGANLVTYVVSNNFGSMTVKAGSKILAYGKNQVAFDLWYGMSPVYNDGVAVTLKAGSEVRGKVEYGADSKITTPFTDKAVLNVEDGADWDKVIYLTSNINLNRAWALNFDCTLNLSGRTITSTDCALQAVEGATLTIAGNGNVIAQEACVMAFDGSKIVIDGGTYTAIDNFVVGTNGTAGRGNNSITINAGTFNGGIQSNGYVACGIYVANSDTVVVNGGTFNITDGAGIVVRAGNVTVGENVVFNMLGESEASGKVGDARIVIPCKAVLVVDLAANYPGYDANTFAFTNNSNYEVYALVNSHEDIDIVKEFANEIVLGANITTGSDIVFRSEVEFDLNNHDVVFTNGAGFSVYTNGVLTIKGNGNVSTSEVCLFAADGGSIIVNGGTYTSTDNFVIGSNGSAGRGGNHFTINAGTFNGGIQSAGYVACGIYVANNDTVVVNGGTFNITNGAGIVARAGNVTVGKNVVFNMLGESEASGKVGDARIVIPCKAVLVIDLAANYPGYDANTFAFINNSNYEILTIEA